MLVSLLLFDSLLWQWQLRFLTGQDVTKIPLSAVSNQSDPIVRVLAAVTSGAAGLVAGADKIDEIAIDRGLCRVMKIDHRVMGVDIGNRGGEG